MWIFLVTLLCSELYVFRLGSLGSVAQTVIKRSPRAGLYVFAEESPNRWKELYIDQYAI